MKMRVWHKIFISVANSAILRFSFIESKWLKGAKMQNEFKVHTASNCFLNFQNIWYNLHFQPTFIFLSIAKYKNYILLFFSSLAGSTFTHGGELLAFIPIR